MYAITITNWTGVLMLLCAVLGTLAIMGTIAMLDHVDSNRLMDEYEEELSMACAPAPYDWEYEL